MPHSKHKKSESQRARQKSRTKDNKIRKYQKLLRLFPDSLWRKAWQEKIDKLK